MSSLVVLLLGFVVMLNYGKGVAMEIAITPNKYDGVIPTSFNITCVPTVSRTCANSKMLAIQLSKNGSRPLVTLQHESVISYNRPILRSSIEAEGRIGNGVGESSKLTVVFSDVLREDSGLYACSALYFDEGGHLQHESATHNFTVEHQDVQDITRYLVGKLVAMETKLQHQAKQLLDQKMQISRLEDKPTQYIQTTDNQTSGFLAGPVTSSSVAKNQVLKFSKVLENVGNDYNTKDGVYTAPVTGLYAFHLYGMVYGSGSEKKYIQVRIQVSDNRDLGILLMEDSDSYDQSSVSCVVKLQAGDRVWCRVVRADYPTNGLYGFPYTGLSGHLIKAF